MLEIKNLMVFFENAMALNDFSMEIKEREFISVLGANSAGKTTLMNTISGLLEDMRSRERRKGGVRITVFGEIRFEGEDIHTMKAKQRVKKGIVLCRERHPIFCDSDVMENLRIAQYLQKRAEEKNLIDSVFEVFPTLKELKRRKAGLLSGGEQQMLIIGMSLVAKPRLLLLDEPLLGLSPLFQQYLVETMKNINQRGMTLLVSEQFARPLLPHIHRGYIIENGMFIIEGTGAELMDNPEVKSAYFGV